MHRTGFWLRALATGIDFFILLVFYIVSTLVLEVDPEARDPRANAGSLYVWGVLIAAFWMALTLFEIFFAATPGKLILGRRIANANGTKALRSTLCVRWFAKNFGGLLLLTEAITLVKGFRIIAGFSNAVVAMGCLMALGETKQTWHDQWAGTAVFRKREVMEPPPGPQMIRGVAPPT